MPQRTSLPSHQHVAFLGASGAVGSEALRTILQRADVAKVVSFGRRRLAAYEQNTRVAQEVVNIHEEGTYGTHLEGCTTAICTLGVGQPSQVSREDFEAIDKEAVLRFARACRAVGVEHFLILSSVSASDQASNWYLRIKGELNTALEALKFARLSIFQPSMILTPTNRYDWKQGVVLKVWPVLNPLLFGPLKQYRGVRVEVLGRAIGLLAGEPGPAVEFLTWQDFHRIANKES